MPASRLNVPQPLDIVAADQVNQLIAGIDREIAELEREATRLTREADELEARLRNDGLDDASMTWTMVRLQLFLDQLRVQAHEDAEATLDVARRRADAAGHRIGLATAFDGGEVARVLPLTPRPAPAPAPPVVDEPRTAFHSTPPPAASEPPTLAWSAPVMAASALVAPVADGVERGAVPTPPSTNGHAPQGLATATAPAPAPAAEPDETSGPVVVPPVATPEASTEFISGPVIPPVSTVVLDAAAAAPALVAAPPQAVPNQAVATPAPAGRSPKKKSVLRRLPISAVLEVVAVLLILVFILLRLS